MKNLNIVESKSFRAVFLIAVMAIVIVLSGNVQSAFASARATDVTEAASGNILVNVPGTFQYTAKSTLLNRINEIRKEACENGYPDPREDGKTNLTSSDYVPIKWSSDLEWIAQTRAAEGSVCWEHERPNGERWYTTLHNGVKSSCENLAWVGGGNLMSGIESWYEEKSDWVNQNTSNETGHYTSMINPNIKYIGLGGFDPKESSGYYGFHLGTVAAEFRSGSGLDETQAAKISADSQTMEIQKSALSVSVDATKKICVGGSADLALTSSAAYKTFVNSAKTGVRLIGNADWSSSNTGIVTVGSGGRVKGVAAGTADITATYEGITCTSGVTVVEHSMKRTVEKATLSKAGSFVEKCGSCGETGSSGTIPKISTVKLAASVYTYNGAVKTPAVTVKDAKGAALKKGTDYTVTYASGRKNPGKYTVTVTFKGNYSGSKKLTFRVIPKGTSLTKLTKATKSFKAVWKKQAAQTTGYQLQYGLKSSFSGAKTKTVSGAAKTNVTVKGLKAKKKYFVRIRAYKTVSGTKYCSAWSKAKTVKVK